MADRFQQRRGTDALWSTQVLADAELGYQRDGNKVVKIGDGATPWDSLLPLNAALFQSVPVFAYVNTSETTTLTTFGDLATVGPEVAFVAQSASLRVDLACHIKNSLATGVSYMTYDLIRVSDGAVVSGASSTTRALIYQGPADTPVRLGVATHVLNGMVPGADYIVRAKYRVSAGTGSFHYRAIGVSS